MKSLFRSDAFSIGLAMFAMFFGAGNIIYPLAVGQFAGDKTVFAICGLILSAAIMPIAGVLAMILFDGDYRRFFGRIGKIPGFFLALAVISLLGPLGSTPRCIALSYTTLKSSFLTLSPIAFSAISCLVIFIFTVRQKHILTLLGWILTPLLLACLITIICVGFFTDSLPVSTENNGLELFWHGLIEGYNTMDLLAAFFFSSTIIAILKLQCKNKTENLALASPSTTPLSYQLQQEPSLVLCSSTGSAPAAPSLSSNQCAKKELAGDYLTVAYQASFIGSALLTLIYVGFSYIASFHGNGLQIQGKDELLAAITLKIAGPYAGTLVCLTIALACLTTAIALITAFTDFIQKEVFKEKISYPTTLAAALITTFFVSIFEFTAISAFLWPILKICYPALIALTLLNIAYSLKGFKPVKTPTAIIFAASALHYLVWG